MPIEIIDLIPEFMKTWEGVKNQPIDEQISAWADSLPADLLTLIQKCYSEDGLDWREIARERIMPKLDGWLSQMQTARNILIEIYSQTFEQVSRHLNFEGKLPIVLYVGIGCGAGWVTHYANQWAILHGLENIVECEWVDELKLRGLIAHEMGHVIHFSRRDAAGLMAGDGIFWQLYIEGFAQQCEQVALGSDVWHMQSVDWLEWCQANRAWLAQEFLRRVDNNESMIPFFGSWENLQGYSQTGYFLGYEALKASSRTLDEWALSDDYKPILINILKDFAES